MMTLVYEIVGLCDSSEKGMIATFFCIIGLLVTRWIYSGHVPLSDLYESLMFFSWSFSLIHIVPYFRNYMNFFSKITAPSAILTQGFATSGLLTKMHQSTILVPALQSHWLMMHVSMMLLSYAALLCGSLLSITLLVITFRRKIDIFRKTKKLLISSFSFDETQYVNFLFRNYHRYQLTQRLDYWSYRVIGLAVWANEAWGSYWNWDPKETWAFITWTIFVIYLHTRTNKSLQGANSAIVASMGFLIIWIYYFGINLLGRGLHSYGSFTLNI
ncbi:unnamed protein product [Victoria cruziana]